MSVTYLPSIVLLIPTDTNARFAAEQYPDAPEVRYHLGSVYAFSGPWEEATGAYRAAYSLRPTNYLIPRICIRRRRESEWRAECIAGCVGEQHAQRGHSQHG
ncbi:MAG: hypothetical protein QF879_00675 [Candidatus Latescibacteria bacterium]|jgi:hypothetical protein|nr:hypothetical protein [Candidatus Latescibacterota bacterium]MDP7235200.1 hypothetical protein [Candidatus Latescibacterota bacterium]